MVRVTLPACASARARAMNSSRAWCRYWFLPAIRRRAPAVNSDRRCAPCSSYHACSSCKVTRPSPSPLAASSAASAFTSALDIETPTSRSSSTSSLRSRAPDPSASNRLNRYSSWSLAVSGEARAPIFCRARSRCASSSRARRPSGVARNRAISACIRRTSSRRSRAAGSASPPPPPADPSLDSDIMYTLACPPKPKRGPWRPPPEPRRSAAAAPAPCSSYFRRSASASARWSSSCLSRCA
mmetsp:Transcript_4812/g.8547  ORF Transcript_4812/g.8547 Transcript_4812/m.8547 type:complete len:241 (+) Transcript_4812:2212-2934(+)